MRLAAAPISWGVCEVPGWGFQLDRERVLDDAVRLGLRDIEAGPPGFLPSDPSHAQEIASRHGVRVIGGFVAVVLHRADVLDEQLTALDRQCAWLAALDSRMLVLAASSGRDGYDTPMQPSEEEWGTLLRALERARDVAQVHGLQTALHPHFGTAIETPTAIDRVIGDSDIDLCLDTGHVFVGGGDAARIAREHGRRVRHVHLKDADAALAAAVRERRLPYAKAVARGLYRPLGAGGAAIAEVLAALRGVSYDGWGVLEQDIALAGAPTEANDPARDVAQSRDFALRHS